ncbi:MAG: hypothetical protein P1V81_13755 [Planctomycetota bacterium]|nr:hypothetical protein [Planctomycetota bacterium]
MTYRTAVAVCLLSLPAATQGWEITPILVDGDSVPGVGLVTSVSWIALNDSLEWRAMADTDHPDTTQDSVVLGPAGVVAREGQFLLLPIGASIGDFNSLALSPSGDMASTLFLDGTGGSATNNGLFWNLDLLAQKGDVSGAVGFSPGTTFGAFEHVYLSDDNELLVACSVDDPAIPGLSDAALMRMITGGSGVLLAELIVAKEGDTLPGTTAQIEGISSGSHSADLNDAGSVIYGVRTNLPADEDHFLLLDDQILAQEGQPSPVAGRDWKSLLGVGVALNNAGDHAYLGILDGDNLSDSAIIRNGVKFLQEGDPVPGFPGEVINPTIGSSVQLTEAGQLLWHGRWGPQLQPNAEGALFIDQELVVQEGVSMVGGLAITEIFTVGTAGFKLESNGRAVLFRAELADGRRGAFLATRPGQVVQVDGCSTDGSSLKHAGGKPLLGGSLDLSYFSPSTKTGARFLGMSSSSIVDPLGCGLFLPDIGEILIDYLPPDPFLIPQGVHTGGSDILPLPVLNDQALVGVTLHFQAVYLFAGDPANPVDLTNALAVTFGL